MALEGSIKDFGLAEIFQLISLQKKSGVLTAHQDSVSATINFNKGQIINATSSMRQEAEKIGRLLISEGKLTEADLSQALMMQEKTGEKIGRILLSSGYISKEDLKEALQVQVKDVIFQILRWRNGWYRFDIQEIEYEKEYQIHVPTDFVLMEGIRMLDEWPYIESIVPSQDIVFSQCYKEDSTETLFSSLSQAEVTVFNLIDGKRDVRTIIDLTQFSEFEDYKILATLLLSGFITQTSTSAKDDMAVLSNVNEKKRLWTAVQIGFLALIVSFILLLLPLSEMGGASDFFSLTKTIKTWRAENELSYLRRAVSYYSLINGDFPDSLELLYNERYLRRNFMTDPWGSPFIYKRYLQNYRLYSGGADKISGTPDDIF